MKTIDYDVRKWDGKRWEYLGRIDARVDEPDESIRKRAKIMFGDDGYLNISNFNHVVC